MLERQPARAAFLGDLARDEDAAFEQRCEGGVELGARHPCQRLERRLGEAAAEHGRVRDQLALARLERVQAGGEQPLDGVRELGGRISVLHDALHHRLGEQRVAAGALGQLSRALGLRARGGEQRLDETPGLLDGQRFEERRLDGPSHDAPVRAPFEQVIARQAQLHHRSAQPAREVFDQVQRAFVRPVDVLPGEHHRLLARERLHGGAHGAEEALAGALLILGGRRGIAGAGAEEPCQGRDPPLSLVAAFALGEQRRQPADELRPRGRGVVVQGDRAGTPQHLDQRPV